MDVFHLRNHPTCPTCKNAGVAIPSLPCERFDNVQDVTDANSNISRIPCLPYSIVDHTSLPPLPTPTASRGSASIVVSTDTLLLPKNEVMRRLLDWTSNRDGSRISHVTGLSKGPAKKRPLVLFPSAMYSRERGCLMATYEGGYCHDYIYKALTCGVWPTVTHGDDAAGLHIHTTPPMNRSPAFVLVAPYTPRNKQGPWVSRSSPSIQYHLDLGTTDTLRDLCDIMFNAFASKSQKPPKTVQKKSLRVTPSAASKVHSWGRKPVPAGSVDGGSQAPGVTAIKVPPRKMSAKTQHLLESSSSDVPGFESFSKGVLPTPVRKTTREVPVRKTTREAPSRKTTREGFPALSMANDAPPKRAPRRQLSSSRHM